MKTQPWISVLAGVVLAFGVAGQAWCQPKCAPGVIYRCARPAVADKCCEPSDVCRQEPGGKIEQAGCERIVQKSVPCAPRKVVTAGEPRRLALPHGSYKRMVPGESPKLGGGCGPAKASGCFGDCRYETIFGTETIFGNMALRQQHACPPGCGDVAGARPLAGIFSQLDASLQKVFVCDRKTCGKSTGKACCHGNGKSKCPPNMQDAPILEGQPHDRRSEENPFRDDAVEPDADQPAPLPPAPLPPAAAAANRIRANVPPSRPSFAHVSERVSDPASAFAQIGAQAVDRLMPNSRSLLDRPGPNTLRRPAALRTSIKLN